MGLPCRPDHRFRLAETSRRDGQSLTAQLPIRIPTTSAIHCLRYSNRVLMPRHRGGWICPWRSGRKGSGRTNPLRADGVRGLLGQRLSTIEARLIIWRACRPFFASPSGFLDLSLSWLGERHSSGRLRSVSSRRNTAAASLSHCRASQGRPQR
jgi:hypothetical protein